MQYLFFCLAIAVAEGDQPRFKITTKRADDTVEVRHDKDKVMFVVKSPFGISQVTIERLEESWPKTVVLRLNLKGLEHFQISNGKTRLDAAASIQGGKVQVRLWKDGNENAPLDKKNPFWTEFQVMGNDGQPARKLPQKDGYFEVTLPRAFFTENPKTITVGWIDFYRG